jgi:hypothetical protein
MKRLRQIFESIAYAGMKPGAPASQSSLFRRLGPLRGPIERFLNGPASSDPFYLTNRTIGQKVRRGLLIAVPFAVVLAGVGLAALGIFDDSSQLPPPTKQLTNAEIAARMLPDLNKPVTLETNRELQVVDVVVQQAGGSKISGTVKNITSHAITGAEVIFDLTNQRGSRVGAVSCKIARVEANSSSQFQNLIPQADAAYAIVREVHTQ